jgi:hypothetical protein
MFPHSVFIPTAILQRIARDCAALTKESRVFDLGPDDEAYAEAIDAALPQMTFVSLDQAAELKGWYAKGHEVRHTDPKGQS